MAVLLEGFIQSIELWLKLTQKQEPLVNPDLDPVLLVPGIAGSILNAVDDDGKEERVWVRILGADHEFCTKLWSRFDPSTGSSYGVTGQQVGSGREQGSLYVLEYLYAPSPSTSCLCKTVSLDKKTRIFVSEDRYGLQAIDVLDPDMIIGQEGVCYYHDMILEMIKWGYKEGKTLFGFGYDFRQSNRLQETLDMFSAKLESVYTLSGGKKLNIISHSMGGLLVKCFMSLHSDIFEKYVKSWIAIAAPFQGAPGYITTSLLNGVSFVDGWAENFFVKKWSMHQLLIECPSIYELMACPDFCWDNVPVLQLWRKKHDHTNNLDTFLESYQPMDSISLMNEALSSNKVGYNGLDVHLPFNLEILKWANETREILSRAKVPPTVKFYNIYGINCGTAHSVRYGSEHSPISDLKELLPMQPKYICVNGDGTVPAESAKADGLDAVARVGVTADHRGILCDRHVFRILKHWLKAGEPDPFYNPLNDYVILPTAFESESGMHKEEWEVISADDIDGNNKPTYSAQVDALSHAVAEAGLAVKQKNDKNLHMEVRAVSVALCG